MSDQPPPVPESSRYRPPPVPPGFPGASGAAPAASEPATYDVASPPPLPPPAVPQVPQWAPPVPVQPLAYGTPVNQRPGIITAIGIISIVVGSLAILFNAVLALQALSMLMISQASGAMTPATPVTTTANLPGNAAPPGAADPGDPNAMPKADRDIVLEGIDSVHQLTPERRKQLDALLAKGGRQMFLFSGPQLTPDAVRRNVTDHGQLPSASGAGAGPDFFVIGQGRIELNDSHAVFFPDGGGEAIRADPSDAELVGWEQGLTPEQLDAVVEEVRKQVKSSTFSQGGNTTPTEAQVTTLRVQLQAPGQAFIKPSPTVPGVTGQVTAAYVDPSDQSLSVTTQQGMLDVDSTGAVAFSNTWGGGAFGAGGGPVFTVSGTAAAMAVAGTLLCGALAVYLIVIGVLVLRQSLRGGRLHLIYAVLKIPAAVLAGVGVAWMWASFLMNVSAAGGTPPGAASGMTAGAIWGAAMLVLLGCLYPIALLITLRTRTVRDYYAAVRT